MKKNAIFLLLADLIWGAAFVAQRTGGDVVGAYSFNSIRNIMGFLVLLPILLIGRRRKAQQPLQTGKIILGGIICGTALFFASNLQQLGITMGSSVGKAGFLTACYILLVPIFGLVLGKKTHWNVLIGVFLALIGLYFLCMTEGSFWVQTSDILLLLSAVSFAVQILAIDHFAPQVDAIFLSALEFLVCGIESAIPMFLFDIAPAPQSWLHVLASWEAWIPLLYAGICSSGIAYTLQTAGQRGLHPTVASLIMSLESVFSVLFGWLLLHERLSSREIAGCITIFVAVTIAQLVPSEKDRITEPA